MRQFCYGWTMITSYRVKAEYVFKEVPGLEMILARTISSFVSLSDMEIGSKAHNERMSEFPAS